MSARKLDRAGDVDEFARLKAEQDPRTVEEMIAADQYEDVVIETAERSGGATTICWDRGTCTSVVGPEVKVGDTVRMYGGAHVGDQRHGWALNGEVVEWETPWERFARRVEWLAGYDRQKRADFARHRARMDADYEALPPAFKARIDRFRAERPDFRIDSEGYEMAAVKDGALFARTAREHAKAPEEEEVTVFWADEKRWRGMFRAMTEAPTDRAIRWLGWWWALNSEVYGYDHKRQGNLMPGMNGGHSGNTFGGACALARADLEGKSL